MAVGYTYTLHARRLCALNPRYRVLEDKRLGRMNMHLPCRLMKDLGIRLPKRDFVSRYHGGKVLSNSQTKQKVVHPQTAAASRQGHRNAGTLQVFKQLEYAGNHLYSLHFVPKQQILHVAMCLNLVVGDLAKKKPKNFPSFSPLADEAEIRVRYRFSQGKKELFPGSNVRFMTIHYDSIHIEDDIGQHGRI